MSDHLVCIEMKKTFFPCVVFETNCEIGNETDNISVDVATIKMDSLTPFILFTFKLLKYSNKKRVIILTQMESNL